MRAIIDEVSRMFGDAAVSKGEIFPSNLAPVLVSDGKKITPHPVYWGFPKWDGKGVIFNARSESALQKPMFSKALLSRRCVIPSAGFYEWAVTSELPKKKKLFFRRPGEEMLYMAGMINTFTDKEGKRKDSFVILTTQASASMSPFHDRMPVILKQHECEDWISNETFMKEVLNRGGLEVEWKIAN